MPTTAIPTTALPAPTMPTSATLTDVLTLKPVDPEVFDVAFTATTGPCPWPKAYGGDMVAQALVAATRTVTDGKAIHSTHAYFLRPVDVGAEVRYEVEVLRDGRGYSTRQVRGFQHGKPVYVCLANFAAGEPGGSFQASMPDDVPAPDELPTSAACLDGRSGGTTTDAARAYWAGGRSVDMRHVPGPLYLAVDGGRVPTQAVWVAPYDVLRPVDGLTTAQRDAAALAYVCDYTILEPLLRVLGHAWADDGLVTASLDHAMWFHRPVAMDGWLLYAQEAWSVADGRGSATGHFFTADGALVATVVQEGMIRATAPAKGDLS
ncbi:acyl-CoA thioesterase [Xylanimonas cellulosilytica DSM 15894]|uniref:Acyl-CoA thioesterase n=1 Tax=Xylanimonas cellulosilytica (strain DSM 15894 / JCM 12276 / CECT 5975 / KCTC 9989 / LMG 20990 / NBRC 107835 / XIL07) TaxID=446471 RepID=D1BV74_XYLCX|nr:acyl-CoA thioesterase domain-containing protein [Xylanimonas cellulosilytica]ACZ29345.1 acyl-CoA thioesterase [Xylanimonas cellulosilytica DSM 15894]